MDSNSLKTILNLFVLFLTFTSGQKFGMPVMEQPVKSNIRQPRIMGLPLPGSNDLGMSRMPPDIPQLPRPRRPLSANTLGGKSTNFGLGNSLGPKTGLPPFNPLGNPFSSLLAQKSAGSPLQRLSNTRNDLTKTNIVPIRSTGLLKPLQTPTYSSFQGNNVYPNRNLTLQQRLLNFLLTRLEQQRRNNQQHQQQNNGAFPDMNTLLMMKAMNPEFGK